MKDDKYIDELFQQNEKGFDKPPRSEAWEKLQKQLNDPEHQNHSINRRWYLGVAASILLVATFFIANQQISKNIKSDEYAQDLELKDNKITKQETRKLNEEDAVQEENRIEEVELTEEESLIQEDISNKAEYNMGETSKQVKNLSRSASPKIQSESESESTQVTSNYNNKGTDANQDQSLSNIGSITAEQSVAAGNIISSKEYESIDESENSTEDEITSKLSKLENNKTAASSKTEKKDLKVESADVARLEKLDDLETESATSFERLQGVWHSDEAIGTITKQTKETQSYGRSEYAEENYDEPSSGWNIQVEGRTALIDFGSDAFFGPKKHALELSKTESNIIIGTTIIRKKEHQFTFEFISDDEISIQILKSGAMLENRRMKRANSLE